MVSVDFVDEPVRIDSAVLFPHAEDITRSQAHGSASTSCLTLVAQNCRSLEHGRPLAGVAIRISRCAR
jgi:hypothetical protein